METLDTAERQRVACVRFQQELPQQFASVMRRSVESFAVLF
jgi:hypothetical protein